MNFFKGLKRAFGLSDDADELDYLDGNAAQPYVNPFRKDNAKDDDERPLRDEETAQDIEPALHEPDVTDNILNRLVEIVNGNLAPVVVKHLNLEAEKNELKASLGQSFEQFVAAVKSDALNHAEVRWGQERDDLAGKLKAAEEVAAGARERVDEAKQKLQVSEAQRKACNARLSEMQQKVEALEAEREQFDLENKSLLNKIKVMQVRGEASDDNELAQKVVTLTGQLEALRKQQADGADAARLEEEYKSKMAITNELINSLRAEAAQQTSLAHDLQAQVDKLNQELDEANENLAIADEIQQQIERVEQTIKHKNQEIEDLKLTITRLESNKEEENLRNKIKELAAEKNELTLQMEQMQRDERERAKTRQQRDIDTANYIDSLKEQLSTAVRINEQLRNEARQLNNLIDNLNEKIDNLTRPVEPAPEPQPEPEPEPEPQPEPVSAIPLDDIDDIDWLSPQPPKKPEPEPEPEKPAPQEVSSRQMSLF